MRISQSMFYPRNNALWPYIYIPEGYLAWSVKKNRRPRRGIIIIIIIVLVGVIFDVMRGASVKCGPNMFIDYSACVLHAGWLGTFLAAYVESASSSLV